MEQRLCYQGNCHCRQLESTACGILGSRTVPQIYPKQVKTTGLFIHRRLIHLWLRTASNSSNILAGLTIFEQPEKQKQKNKKPKTTCDSITNVPSSCLCPILVIFEEYGQGTNSTGYTELENLWLMALPI